MDFRGYGSAPWVTEQQFWVLNFEFWVGLVARVVGDGFPWIWLRPLGYMLGLYIQIRYYAIIYSLLSGWNELIRGISLEIFRYCSSMLSSNEVCLIFLISQSCQAAMATPAAVAKVAIVRERIGHIELFAQKRIAIW